MGKKKKKKRPEPEVPKSEPRARLTQAERRQRNIELRWGTEANDRSWMKHARCFICRKLFCVNNNPAREVFIPRRRGHPICGWCDNRPTTDFVIIAIEFYYANGKSKIAKAHQELKAGSFTGMGK